MFKNTYKDTFSSLHASAETLEEVMKMTKENKKTFSTKRLRVLPICAIVTALLICTAFAIYYANTALTYFNGDTTLIEPDVQAVDEVQKQGEYMLNVDFLRFDPESSDGTISLTYTAVPAEADSVKRSFSIHLAGVGAPNTLRVYLDGSSDEDAIVLSLDQQIESLSVTAVEPSEINDYFIRSCELNATGLTLEVKFKESVKGDKIVEFYFRMADGSLKTLSQLCGKATSMNSRNTALATGVQENSYLYTTTFRTLIDPLQISGILMNGMEYSFLDPNDVVPAEVPVAMRPFLTPFVEMNDSFYFYAYDVCEHIDASIEKLGEQYTIRYLDKIFSFTPENRTVTLNGEVYDLDYPATYDNNSLCLSGDCFTLLGLKHSMYYPENGPVHAPENWLVTP